jgi:hypothetical protein
MRLLVNVLWNKNVLRKGQEHFTNTKKGIASERHSDKRERHFL